MTSVPLFECVPNFSEGRHPQVLAAIREAAIVPGVSLLGFDSDSDHNRSVLTLVGPAEALLTAVFQTMEVAVAQIDLNSHKGVHPRIGAVDVVPFVPWRAATMGQARELARQLGEQVASQLNLPVYFYAEAATTSERVNLQDVRRGEFEGLAERLLREKPDLGPSKPHATAGAVAIGARQILVAFNVFLRTQDIKIARAVARAVRGSSGGLLGVKALAMDTRSQSRVQVSMNLVDYPRTPLPRVLEMVRLEAQRFGVAIAETEVVGLMPQAVVDDVMRYYLQMPGFSRDRVLETALLARDPE